jgi:hypothetical protein
MWRRSDNPRLGVESKYGEESLSYVLIWGTEWGGRRVTEYQPRFRLMSQRKGGMC